MIYLDHNATTPLDEAVKKAMADAFGIFGNPSSGHGIGMAAKAVVEGARQQVARLIACDPREIVFTSGGTESNNLAIVGTAYKFRTGHIITSVIEHPSAMNPVKWLELRGFEATYLPVDSDGRVSPADVRKAIRRDTVLITVMHSNNETGVLQPSREIGEIAREHGIAFHADAAQSVGKMDVLVADLAVDMLTIVAHKFYGPKGVGALYIRGFGGSEGSARSHIPNPILFGAGHESGMRPGTENIIGISGFGRACETAALHIRDRYEHTRRLRDRLYTLLRDDLDIKLNGHELLRLPNTLNISIGGIVADDVVQGLKDKLSLSSGSACHAGIRKPSPVLKAMGVSDEEALSAIRLSVGKDNTDEEIEAASVLITRYIKSLF
ncbi:MAG: cysteine desulfurase [Nitrospirae bacterium]|nr:cysteine desulfurase [Nitrospirota bacterium]MCL5238681.1 cysteine desulfurase [Nitrospirota bacterium]